MEAAVLALPTRAAEAAYPLVLRVAMKCNGDSIAVKISIDNLDRRYALASTRLTPR